MLKTLCVVSLPRVWLLQRLMPHCWVLFSFRVFSVIVRAMDMYISLDFGLYCQNLLPGAMFILRCVASIQLLREISFHVVHSVKIVRLQVFSLVGFANETKSFQSFFLLEKLVVNSITSLQLRETQTNVLKQKSNGNGLVQDMTQRNKNSD